eukprot:Skav228019  [mRNA]  locus=scaffold1073:131465:135209:+ [translate_table: standard]
MQEESARPYATTALIAVTASCNVERTPFLQEISLLSDLFSTLSLSSSPFPLVLHLLQEFVHSKFFELQDQERREMMAAFAARWDPYNRTRLFRKAFDGWVEFLRRMNKSREALAKVKQVYAKTHVTARLRSWWYLMQRDHTDNQFRRLSENLESQEALLEDPLSQIGKHPCYCDAARKNFSGGGSNKSA